MVVITLIGEHQAIEGQEFVYRGPLTECRDCKLKGVCFNLEAGSRYRIKSLRNVTHDCRIHEDSVRVVEVVKVPSRCSISQKSAIEGSTITYDEIKCKTLGCRNYRACHPTGIEKGVKIKIIKITNEISCPERNRLVQADVE